MVPRNALLEPATLPFWLIDAMARAECWSLLVPAFLAVLSSFTAMLTSS
jgi:hypothetical protein